MSAHAQATPAVAVSPVFSLDARLTATNNGALSEPGQERDELAAAVRPRLVMARRGAGFEFDLDAAATFLAYANGTQRNGVQPDLRAALRATVVEHLFFFDAAAQVRQAEADPFGARADVSTGANRRTESTYRLSPYLERDVAPLTSLLVRHDLTLLTNGAGVGSRLMSNRSLVRLERKPQPLGAVIEVSRLANEPSGVADSRFTLDTARLRGNLSIAGELVLGVTGGTERSRLGGTPRTDSLYGVGVYWGPSPRTELAANFEQRFFGRGGELAFRHRTPFMSFAVAMSRLPALSSTSLGVFGQGADLRSFLDAILTTRYPDPSARKDLVDSLVTNRGVDTRFANPVDLVADYPQIQTAANATLVWLGRRNTASLTLYSQTARQIKRDGDALPAATAVSADSRQSGGSLQFNRQLAPQTSAEATVRWSKITGLAARTGDVTQERSHRLTLTQSLSPRTGVSAGVQQNRFTSTVGGKNSYDATLVFVGLSHRF